MNYSIRTRVIFRGHMIQCEYVDGSSDVCTEYTYSLFRFILGHTMHMLSVL